MYAFTSNAKRLKKQHKITFYGPKRIISMFPQKYSFHTPHMDFVLLKI